MFVGGELILLWISSGVGVGLLREASSGIGIVLDGESWMGAIIVLILDTLQEN